MQDQLGSRMKDFYEDRARLFLPRRTYTIIRLDGKAFHTFTRGFKRPFDYDLMGLMDETSKVLAKEIQGVKFCYTQSDEISLLLTDFETEQTDAWFDGNIQKIASVSASIATAAFNRALLIRQCEINDTKDLEPYVGATELSDIKLAYFDSRVFTIADRAEVKNYFIWRQQDATRNSIQMAAQALYSQKELHGQNTSQLQEIMWQKGVNWNDYPSAAKRGRAIVKEYYQAAIKANRPQITQIAETVTRSRWTALTGMDGKEDTPIFTEQNGFLDKYVPKKETP